jgi:hypothetical protein
MSVRSRLDEKAQREKEAREAREGQPQLDYVPPTKRTTLGVAAQGTMTQRQKQELADFLATEEKIIKPDPLRSGGGALTDNAQFTPRTRDRQAAEKATAEAAAQPAPATPAPATQVIDAATAKSIAEYRRLSAEQERILGF